EGEPMARPCEGLPKSSRARHIGIRPTCLQTLALATAVLFALFDIRPPWMNTMPMTKEEMVKRLKEGCEAEPLFPGVLANPVTFAARWGLPIIQKLHGALGGKAA